MQKKHPLYSEALADDEKDLPNGEPSLIAEVSKTPETKRFGFMAGQIKAPRDFNTMNARKIQKLFEGKE